MTIWSALLDPFGFWLPVDKLAGFQHFFYPTLIALCGAFVMISFRRFDRFSLDKVIEGRRGSEGSAVVPAD